MLKKCINIFNNEILTASSAFFTFVTINSMAQSDVKIYHALNKNAATWNIITSSLRDNFLITLGRIFDKNKRSFSACYFIDKCKKNIHEFGADSLRERKIESVSGDEPEWLDGYIEGAYSPSGSDFDKLGHVVSQAYEMYSSVYEKIRHKLVAHADAEAIFGSKNMFEQTSIDTIKQILRLLFQVHGVVWQLYYNGMNIDVGDYNFNEEEYVSKDVKGLLEMLAKE